MTDNERDLVWRGLVASMLGEEHVDRLLSLVLYTTRELAPEGADIDGINVRLTFKDGRPPLEFPARKTR
jgi:hypothetical protein